MKIGNFALFDMVRKVKRDYIAAFGGPAGQDVLRDLAKFCRADQTCFTTDPRQHALLEGRREVWLRIQHYLNLTTEQIYALVNGQTIQLPTDEEDT